MNYKTDKRIAEVATSIPQNEIDLIMKRSWFKVVRRENTPLWESLIQAGGALSDGGIGFKNPMKELFALDYDKYAADEDFKSLKSQFIALCDKDLYFLTKFFVHLEKECMGMDSFIASHLSTDWRKTSDLELGKAYDQFVNYSLRILTFLWPPLAPEEWIVGKISDEVAKHIDPVKEYESYQNVMHLLTGSTKLSLMQERQEAMTELALRMSEHEDFARFGTEIEEVYKKYAWINDHSLKFEYESKDHFIGELKSIIDSNPVETWERMVSEKKKQSEERNEIIKRLALPKNTIEYAHQASLLPHWRLLRTEKSVEAAYYLQGLFKEIGRRLDIDDILLCYYWEIGNILDGKSVDRTSISSRKDGYGLIIMEDKIYDLDKASRSAIKTAIESKIELGKVIKGNVACRGFVKGKVRVLKSTKELSTFKDGEILVTAMTTPEYVPIMKMAAAILTDEGGISCHAAIVSRELKIPCVIGTKNATKLLKTGDMVEVDANKGVVIILEKK